MTDLKKLVVLASLAVVCVLYLVGYLRWASRTWRQDYTAWDALAGLSGAMLGGALSVLLIRALDL